ncbi:MAG TPA: tRNA (guanosine(46)-N7)-methyltransferase TrmB [Dermatophilaceae bacterium]|nr:tRNA (guanosine(46)-N7)-methyltransferase TrmB [Dermatophilaceae bacterium]
MAEPAVRREVVSFSRRGARLTAGEQRAWDRYAGCFLLDVARGPRSTSVLPGPPVDWAEVFGRLAPLVLDVGSGSGEAPVAAAVAQPDRDFVAVEVYRPGVAKTLQAAGRAGVANLRVVQADAVDVLTRMVAPSALAEVWTFFPDPWPKSRHHKRRLVSPAFAVLVASRLAPGGAWRLATDWPAYRDHIAAVVATCPTLHDPYAGSPAPRGRARPVTRYERKAAAAGRAVTELELRRR